MRLVYAVAAHLHMTAGAVMTSMGAHELFCWAYLLTEGERVKKRGRMLSVEDEIAMWKKR